MKHLLRPSTLAVTAALASGVMLFLSIGVHRIWPFVWVATIPVFLVAFRSTARASAVVAFAAWAIGGMSIAEPYLRLAPVPLLATMVLVPALAFAGLVLVARYAEPRLSPALAFLVFPLAWTAFDRVVGETGGYGLAYTQLAFLPIMQVASLAGGAAVTFLVTLVPSAIAVAIHRRSLRPLGIGLGAVAVALIFGQITLSSANVDRSVKVGLAATDRTVGAFDASTADEAIPVLRAYADRVGRLAERGATIAVLPEKFVGIAPAYAAEARAILAEAARAHHVTVVAGLNERDAGGIGHNVALVFSPSGELTTSYEKRHLIPFFEDGYAVGPGIKLVPRAMSDSGLAPEIANAPWGVAICKDMDFPSLGAEYGAAGVGLMLVPAWDFVKDAQLHGYMAILRGIENGYAVVRAAQEGLLTVSDQHGHLVEKPSFESDEALLVTSVQRGDGHSPYARYGDWFAMLCPLLAATLVFLGGRRRPKELASRAGS